MRFSSDKKSAIVLYLLEKIRQNTPALSQSVAEAFGVSRNTVHTYINELIAQGVIEKGKRGQYTLATQRACYRLERARGELNDDMRVFDVCLWPHIADLPENVRRIWAYAISGSALTPRQSPGGRGWGSADWLCDFPKSQPLHRYNGPKGQQ